MSIGFKFVQRNIIITIIICARARMHNVLQFFFATHTYSLMPLWMFVCTFQRMLQNVREQNCGFSGINACNLNANIYRQYRFIDDLFYLNTNSEINSQKSLNVLLSETSSTKTELFPYSTINFWIPTKCFLLDTWSWYLCMPI